MKADGKPENISERLATEIQSSVTMHSLLSPSVHHLKIILTFQGKVVPHELRLAPNQALHVTSNNYYISRMFGRSMWGSLRLAPIILDC